MRREYSARPGPRGTGDEAGRECHGSPGSEPAENPEIGRRQWKEESGYYRQARVENTFFRYKTTIGPELRARHPQAQEAEAIIACNVLNRMMGLGRPESFAIGG